MIFLYHIVLLSRLSTHELDWNEVDVWICDFVVLD